MERYDSVSNVEVLNRTDGQALVQFETTLPMLLLPARDSGVPLEMPFELSNGIAIWEVQTSSDRLSELSDQLDFFDISFTVEYIQYDVDEKQLLTDSQEELIEKAIQMGYYDTPRECSLTELAEEIGRSKSTVSETLHRAEGKIIKQVASGSL
jgi:predicted DNA binding protein